MEHVSGVTGIPLNLIATVGEKTLAMLWTRLKDCGCTLPSIKNSATEFSETFEHLHATTRKPVTIIPPDRLLTQSAVPTCKGSPSSGSPSSTPLLDLHRTALSGEA